MPFDPRAYEMHRVDALISERMTASPYVVDIYGYCGTSSVYEQGISNLEHDLRFRKGKNELKSHPPLADATKALYASQVAQALLDLHGLDYPENRSNTTIVHADIKPESIRRARTTPKKFKNISKTLKNISISKSEIYFGSQVT